MNYYNEFDPKAAAWLRELIRAGEIPPGDVDVRSITEVKPHELTKYVQHHFFAGIGGWALALRLAEWPDNRPVCTASLPCQPFSAAGKQEGAGDHRHLWPVFFDLAKQCGFERIFGEQVAQAIGFNWLDGISADLEAEGYTVGSIVLGAHSVGAPHRRQRLYWMANAGQQRPRRSDSRSGQGAFTNGSGAPSESGGSSRAGRLADMQRPGLEGLAGNGDHGHKPGRERADTTGSTAAGGGAGDQGMGDAESGGWARSGGHAERAGGSGLGGMDDTAGRCPWSNFDIIPCRDGKHRRIPGRAQPNVLALADGFSDDVDAGWRQSDGSIFPLAKGVQGRTGILRGAGNAIVPAVAAHFIQACEEAIGNLP